MLTADTADHMETAVTTDAPYRVGDVVELTHDLAGRSRLLKAGARGEVEVVGLSWNQVSVRFGRGANSRLFLLAPRHLRRVGAGEE